MRVLTLLLASSTVLFGTGASGPPTARGYFMMPACTTCAWCGSYDGTQHETIPPWGNKLGPPQSCTSGSCSNHTSCLKTLGPDAEAGKRLFSAAAAGDRHGLLAAARELEARVTINHDRNLIQLAGCQPGAIAAQLPLDAETLTAIEAALDD